MKPREFLDDKELQYYFTPTKLVNLGRYLRSYNLFPHGQRGKDDHLTASHAVMALYLLACDTTAKRVHRDLHNYTTIFNSDHGRFIDVINKLFRDRNKIQLMEINMSSAWPMVVLKSGYKDITFNLEGKPFDYNPVMKICRIHQVFIGQLQKKILYHDESYTNHPSINDISKELREK